MTFPLTEPDLSDDLLAPYWEGFEDEEIRLPRCFDCGEFHWYVRSMCPHCQSKNLEWEALSGEVTLFTWVELRYDFGLSFLEDKVPLYTGLAIPAEDEDIRLVVAIDVDEGEPEIGMDLVPEFVSGGPSDRTVPVFRPA